MKSCPFCGASIIEAHANRMYCSSKCKRKAAYYRFKEQHGIYDGYEKYRYRVDNNLCRRCGKPLINKHTLCDECLSKSRKWNGGYNRRLKEKIIKAYGGKCVCCGETTLEFLSIDHIKGNGNEHRRQLRAEGTTLYVWLERHDFPKDDYQLLCYNCNMAKAFYGICPHKESKSEEGGITES